MSRQTDFQVFWIILLAGALYIAIWQHDEIQHWIQHVLLPWLGI